MNGNNEGSRFEVGKVYRSGSNAYPRFNYRVVSRTEKTVLLYDTVLHTQFRRKLLDYGVHSHGHEYVRVNDYEYLCSEREVA